MIDLRSDTVTRPTPGMRAAMMAAEVGDDVYGEDPAVNRLESRVAELLGKEAALFTPSGCMANMLAVRAHCRPGDELLCESTAHVVLWEAGGAAALWGVTTRTVEGHFGRLSLPQLEGKLNPDDMHSPPTKLVWLENTHNRGGGTIQSLESIAAITAWARDHKVATHLDGARLWNASVATGTPPSEYARHFDTVSVCFSKGLGAPVGSALAGTAAQITAARRARKLMGGAMRQVGFLAAACLYALDHHVERLAEDHANAKLLAEAVRASPHLALSPDPVETNVVWAEVRPELGTAQQVAARLKRDGVLVAALGKQLVRMVTHHDVTRSDCEAAARRVAGLRAG